MDHASCKEHRVLSLILLLLVLGWAFLTSPAAAQGSKGEPIYKSQEGAGYKVYADGSLNIGGDVQGSCDTVLQEVQQTGAKPPREIYRQVEACEDAGFSVPGSESLPETGGPSLPIVAALGLILSCALYRLGTRGPGPLEND